MNDTADHLRIDHLEGDLALRSARGSVVTLVAQATKFVTGVGATMVLARLLGPDDFGLAAMALATVSILARIKDAGLFTATIQSSRIDQAQATALFWMSSRPVWQGRSSSRRSRVKRRWTSHRCPASQTGDRSRSRTGRSCPTPDPSICSSRISSRSG